MTKNVNIDIVRIEEASKFSILNKNTIRSIFALGDPAFGENLVVQYLKMAKERSLNITEDIKRKKTTEVYANAKELRDSSLYIGTERIAAISTFIYDQARKRNIPPLKEAALTLSVILKESEKVLMDFIYAEKNRL